MKKFSPYILTWGNKTPKTPDLQLLLLEQWSNIKRSNLPHSELAHSYICGVPTLTHITISQVYLGHISLCLSVRAERASPEDLQLTGQEGSWLVKNSYQRTQKRGQNSEKVNAHRHCADCEGILRDTAQWL